MVGKTCRSGYQPHPIDELMLLKSRIPLKDFGRGPRYFDAREDNQDDSKAEHLNWSAPRLGRAAGQSRVMPEGISPLPTSDDTTLLSDTRAHCHRYLIGGQPFLFRKRHNVRSRKWRALLLRMSNGPAGPASKIFSSPIDVRPPTLILYWPFVRFP